MAMMDGDNSLLDDVLGGAFAPSNLDVKIDPKEVRRDLPRLLKTIQASELTDQILTEKLALCHWAKP